MPTLAAGPLVSPRYLAEPWGTASKVGLFSIVLGFLSVYAGPAACLTSSKSATSRPHWPSYADIIERA